MPQSLTNSIHIDAPVAEVFACVRDPSNFNQLMPGVTFSEVSLTIPIHKRVPFMPWIKVPAATITFSGRADVHAALDVPRTLLERFYHGMAEDREKMARYSLIDVKPEKEFLTYGIGVSLLDMRDTQKARKRAPVGV